MKLAAGALCVICPTDILLTPVDEIFLTFFRVTPPEASVSLSLFDYLIPFLRIDNLQDLIMLP